MELEFHFDGLADDVTEAVADVHIEDLAVADAPSTAAPVRVGPVSVSAARPSVRVSVDLPPVGAAYEPGLIVRVRGRTASQEVIEFLNTSATPLPRHPAGPVRVVLTRIK